MKPGFLLSVTAIMVALFFGNRFLASLEQREILGEAESLYKRGEQLLAGGKAAEATEPLHRAHALVRGNPRYQLALARALLAARRLREAELNLRELLERNSNDGAINLAMARLEVQAGNQREAEAFYHRAIYGTWPAGGHPSEVRMELAEFLARSGEEKQLLSEVLLLQGESGHGAEMQKKVARLFLTAGSPGRAADGYRSLLRENPGDVEAYLGLAEAEMMAGHFNAAQSNLRSALRRKPEDAAIQQRLEFAARLSALDPTLRRLPSKEKFNRSNEVLELAKEDLAACTHDGKTKQMIVPLLTMANRQQMVKRPMTNESAEALLALAEDLWRARIQVCGQPSSRNEPLPLLMQKIAQ
jgi:predicted Zn-dependent protease